MTRTGALLVQTNPRAASVTREEAQTTDPLAELYDLHGATLFRYALMILADAAAAEDAVQETFVHLARALHRQPPPDVTYAYLATAVRNECFSMQRRRRRRPEEPLPLLEREAADASEEERLILDGALAALPAEQREVMYLKVFEGLTFQEIGERCGVNVNTAASRYRYAAAALRRALAPEPRP